MNRATRDATDPMDLGGMFLDRAVEPEHDNPRDWACMALAALDHAGVSVAGQAILRHHVESALGTSLAATPLEDIPDEETRPGMPRPAWVCTKCCKKAGLDGASIRARFAGEGCPRCDDPGSGMMLVSDNSGRPRVPAASARVGAPPARTEPGAWIRVSCEVSPGTTLVKARRADGVRAEVRLWWDGAVPAVAVEAAADEEGRAEATCLRLVADVLELAGKRRAAGLSSLVVEQPRAHVGSSWLEVRGPDAWLVAPAVLGAALEEVPHPEDVPVVWNPRQWNSRQ